MMERLRKTNWTKVLLIPLALLIMSPGPAYLWNWILEEDKTLSYTIEEPISYLNQTIGADVKLEIEGEKTNQLYAHRIRLWNSGDKVIKDVPVQIAFEEADSTFRIFSISHSTKPKREFGSITQDRPRHDAVRFTYGLLNTTDSDLVTILSNYEGVAELYAKAEGLERKFVAFRGEEEWGVSDVLSAILVLAHFFLGSYVLIDVFRNKKVTEDDHVTENDHWVVRIPKSDIVPLKRKDDSDKT